MRKLASIQRIKAIAPIEGADAIEKIEVLGWELVAKKGDFKVDDFCVYVEIDSILPDKPEFEFMRPRKFRIRTIRLRGQISQGIAFPTSILPSGTKIEEDLDVTDLLGITKHDPEQESLVVAKEPVFDDKNKYIRFYKKHKYLITKRIKKALGISTKTVSDDFPSYIPRTDETRVQNMHRGLATHEGKVAYVSEKLEGSSTTFIAIKSKGSFLKKLFSKQPMRFIVCSRNRIVNNKIDDRWYVAKKYDIEKKLTALKMNIAIQGELIGPKIQDNIYKLDDKDFRMYLAYDIDAHKYLTYNELVELSKELSIPLVPILDDNHIIHTDIKQYVDLSLGNSVLNNKQKREGVVFRLRDENFSFKSINPAYLFEKEEKEERESKKKNKVLTKPEDSINEKSEQKI